MTSTAVAHFTGPISVLPAPQQNALEKARAQIQPYLPRGIDFDAVISDVYLAVRKNPDLLQCDPMSLVDAVTEVQQRGLRIGSTCHLVPKGGKVLAWNDYRGDIEMIIRSGACRDVEANVVYANEHFELRELTTGPEMVHEIIQDAAGRGPMKGAYAKYYLGMGRYRVKYMPLADIEKIRATSLTWSPTSKKPVRDCPPWYAVKTVVRQGAKLLPKNPKMVDVYAVFSREEREAAIVEAATPRLITDGAGETVDTSTGEVIEPAAVATPVAETTAPAHGSLEWAQSLPLPLSKSEFYNRPLGTLPREFLSELPAWCESKMNAAADAKREVSPAVADLYTAVNMLLETPPAFESHPIGTAEAIDDDDIPQAPAEPSLGIEAPQKGAPAGSLSYTPPKGGKVEDALGLALNDKPAKPNRNAQEI